MRWREATVVARSPMKLLALVEEHPQGFLRDIPEVRQRVRTEASLRLAANGSDGD